MYMRCAALASLGLLAQPVRQDKQAVYHFSHSVAAVLPLAQLVRSAAQRSTLLCRQNAHAFLFAQSVEVAQTNPDVFSVEDEARLEAPCALCHGSAP